MKEIILCRLGSCFAPHWIQMRWFEHNNIKGIITLEPKCRNISYKEWEKYRSNPNHRMFVNNRDSYLHYEKVDNPNPFKTNYEYTNEHGYNFISKNEKDRFYLNDEKLERDFENCLAFHRRTNRKGSKKMKVRMNYVSNSSSSSYVIAYDKNFLGI